MPHLFSQPLRYSRYVNVWKDRAESGGPSLATTCSRVIPGSMVTTCAWSGALSAAAASMAPAIALIPNAFMAPPLDADTREHGFEDAQPVVGAEQLIHRAFRVGHHTEHVA